MTEDAWQSQVIDLAHLYRWLVAHFRPARTAKGWRTPVQADGAGFPDLVLVRDDELIIVELKSDRGKPTEAQLTWLLALAGAGVEAHVWRPSDFDAVHARLKR